jgi:cyclophilin family peptidyl-prolyl cis-trans isomerase/HEAT repeat protein
MRSRPGNLGKLSSLPGLPALFVAAAVLGLPAAAEPAAAWAAARAPARDPGSAGAGGAGAAPSAVSAVSAPAPGSGGGSPADLPVLHPPDLNLLAMLLLMQEHRAYEPVTVLEALKGGPALRAELATALGRTPDSAGRSALEGLLIDDQAAVRRAAAFGLGVLGDPAARPALLKAARDGDRETGTLAVEALGKLGVPVLEVGEQLLTLAEPERWARLLPSLYRFKEEAQVPLAEHGLGLAGGELHRWAAYALARDPQPAGVALLRPLIGDPDPLIRAWAARGLGRAGGVPANASGASGASGAPRAPDAPDTAGDAGGGPKAGDLALLEPLLGDGDAGPVIEALRAGAAMVARGQTPPAAAWRPRLLALLGDARAGVRVTAVEAAAAWLPDETLAAGLAALAGGGAPAAARAAAPAERGLAVVALARGGDRRAAALMAAAADAVEPQVRARAAEAAGLLGDKALLDRLAADPSPLVREAVLTARLPAAPRPASPGAPASPATPAAGGAAAGFSPAAEQAAAAVAAAALSDSDEGVRTTACGWLAEHPVVALAQLSGAVTSALRDESIESPLGAVKALAARAAVAPLERGAAVELLERVAGQPSWVLRREAGAALVRLGRPAPAPAPAIGGRSGELAERLEIYRQIVEQTRRPRTVEVRTTRGSFRIRLDCPAAPRTCLSFLTLAGQHFYDGLLFHRVVPDFVIQAGDPRGDGFGGPGYLLPDEINPLRYRRGVVGMALAGPDTGGSQFFVALSPQPHLDGGYTAFGEVVAGVEVLDAIEAGDRIESIVEIR